MSVYTELHLHTSFSFLDGASQPEELIGRAVDLGFDALAITDHNGLYGAMEFAQMANGAGVRPITGAEITLLDGTHLTLLAENQMGYGNLCRLLTEAHRLRDPNPPSGRFEIPFPLRTIGVSRPAQRSETPDPRLDPTLLKITWRRPHPADGMSAGTDQPTARGWSLPGGGAGPAALCGLDGG